MNVIIFSGGTGSASLAKGLMEFNPYLNITSIINCYDNGLSTGFCRKLLNVLGPSDLRKNQYRFYELSNIVDHRIKDLFNGRENLNEQVEPRSYVLNKVCNELGFIQFEKYINYFFDVFKEKEYGKSYLKDFNLANIIYAAMFKVDGYEKTISFFKNFLHIDNNVILNSYNNTFIYGVTDCDRHYPEEELVKLNRSDEKIVNVIFDAVDKADNTNEAELHIKIQEKILEADLIVFSAGTQWSSLIPTYKYNNLYKIINKAKGEKIFVMNNEPDLDMVSEGSLEILTNVERFLDLSNTNILINKDANPKMQIITDQYNYTFSSMWNIDGRHKDSRLAKKIFNIYFADLFHAEHLLFDFDDTIFGRDVQDEKVIKVSHDNFKLLSELTKYVDISIVSGNSYRKIKNALLVSFGLDYEIPYTVWADGGIVKYNNGKMSDVNPKYVVYCHEMVINDIKILDLSCDIRPNKEAPTCISIKPINDKRLKKIVREFFELKHGQNNRVVFAGRESVDILRKDTNKVNILSSKEFKNKRLFYIGDEADFSKGNDYAIAKKCSGYYNVKNVFETNTLLRFLKVELENA